jgi:outer membrane receptor protein involved in Fe transport
MRTVYRLLPAILFSNCIHAQTIEIKGHVREAEHNEPLSGAVIYLKESGKGTVTATDGEYKFTGLTNGIYTIIASYIGYDSITKIINTAKTRREKGEAEEIEINFLLRPAPRSLNEVSIQRKRDNETDESARYKEKNGDQVVNIVGARTIEISPDITAANVLQRVSGVSLERSNEGDGRYAIIRGMDQRYDNTLINGCKIPSPDPYARYVPLDLIPSELLQKIEVYKSLTPDMEGDAIGGTVNMEMKNAPDEKILHANVFTGYSNPLWDQPFQAFNKTSVNNQDPSAAHTPGYIVQPNDFTRRNLEFNANPFTPNYAAGLIAGGRYLHGKLGILISGTLQNKFATSNEQHFYVAPHLDGTPYYTDGFNRTIYDQTIRSGFNGKIDYQFNARNNISFTNIYLNLQDLQSRFTSDTSLTTFRTGPGTGQVFLRDRSSHNTQAIEAAILNGKHQIRNNLLFTWTGLYSVATNSTPDMAEVSRDYLIDAAHHHSPTFFDGMTRIWQHNRDQDYSVLADLNYKPFILGHLVELKAGGLYRRKSRFNYQNDFELRDTSLNTTKQIYSSIETVQWRVFSHGYGNYGASNYDASENVSAYFIQAKTTIGSLQILAGVRVENTDDEYTTHLPASLEGSAAHITYSDFLPNLQLKYTINSKQNLRFAVYQSLARPAYFDYVPSGPAGTDYNEIGNPYLLHTQAYNGDLRYELYPSATEEILAGVFYKKLVNPIERAFTGTDPYNPVLSYSSDGTAVNYGFEFAIIKYFGHFGFNVNYTYTNSSITTTKAFADTLTGHEDYKPETRPLQGQSRHIANAAILYHDEKMGLHIELAYQFTGKRISDVGLFYGTDYYQQDMSELDLSANKKEGKHFELFIKVNNLLNSPYIVKLTNGLQVEKDYFGFSYLFGCSYKFH